MCEACELVLETIRNDGPTTTAELFEAWFGDPEQLNTALHLLRNRGQIVCTDGIWWYHDEQDD